MSEENIKKKINSLLNELQDMIGASNDEMDEFKSIIDVADFSQDENNWFQNIPSERLTRCLFWPNKKY